MPKRWCSSREGGPLSGEQISKDPGLFMDFPLPMANYCDFCLCAFMYFHVDKQHWFWLRRWMARATSSQHLVPWTLSTWAPPDLQNHLETAQILAGIQSHPSLRWYKNPPPPSHGMQGLWLKGKTHHPSWWVIGLVAHWDARAGGYDFKPLHINLRDQRVGENFAS